MRCKRLKIVAVTGRRQKLSVSFVPRLRSPLSKTIRKERRPDET